jgi:hypothetical protein
VDKSVSGVFQGGRFRPFFCDSAAHFKPTFKVYTLWERRAVRPNENAERQIFKAHKMSKINGSFFYETVFIQ